MRMRVVYGVSVILIVGAVVFFVVAPRIADARFNAVTAPPPYTVSPEVQGLHDSLFVADLHADFLLWDRDLLERHTYGHVDLPRLRAGNVGLQVFSVVTKSPRGQNYDRNAGDSDRITLLAVAEAWPVRAWGSLKERALYQAARLRDAAAASGNGFVLLRTRNDLDTFLERRAANPELVAGLLAMEGQHPLEGDLANVDVFFDAGYRMMAPTHFFDNAVAGSVHGIEKGGLTDLGRQVVRRMEALGIVVDLAHVSHQTIDDVLAMASRPVVVSHTGVQGTCPGPRNLTDDHVRRIAAQGGVIGIGFWKGAVCEATPEAIARAIRYTADLAGVDHVALGSDFDGTVETPFDASGVAQITGALLAQGFMPGEIRKIMGGNVLRLLRQTLPSSTTAASDDA